MHGLSKLTSRVLLALGVLALALAPAGARGDDTGFFGRLFRLGGNSSSASAERSGRPAASSNRSARLPYGPAQGATGSVGQPATPPRSSGAVSSPIPFEDGPSTPEVSGDSSAQPRVTPRPRASSAVTSADPLLTRIALGRSNDGSQFGMFLQVFADGTVIDSEGVHKLSASELRPIAELIQGGELTRVRGHCSSPSADFVEHVQVVVFERRMGRLQAHSLSYSGNPQGCDVAIRQLHTVLEGLQAKLSRQPIAATAPSAIGQPVAEGPGLEHPSVPAAPALAAPMSRPLAGGGPMTGARPVPSLPDPDPASSSRSVIPLSPVEPR